MPWDDRQGYVGQFAFHHMEVSAADAADVDFNKDLIWLWNRDRTILKPQRIAGDVASMVEHHGFHSRLG